MLRQIGAVLVALLAVGACKKPTDDYRPAFSAAAPAVQEFSFAVHPLHNPQLLAETYGPLVDQLNQKLPGIKLRFVASNSYGAFEQRLAAQGFDFALPNPYQALQAAENGYEVFGKMADDQLFRGIILVRRDAGVRTVADLRGKTISYPAPTALAATMLPQQFLRDHGLGTNATRTVYVGSQESSIDSVYRGFSTAAGTWPPPWQAYARTHPEVATTLEVKWQTDPLINNALVVRRTVPAGVRRAVASALFTMQDTAEGRRVLAKIGTSKFEPATVGTYAPVAAFIAKFKAAGGPSAASGDAR